MVKLDHLPQAISSKVAIAGRYLDTFTTLRGVKIPTTASFSNHTYHQFTLRIQSGQREAFTAFMQSQGIATMIYYPIPLHKQKAYMHFEPRTSLEVSERLADGVVSLPVHEALENHEILMIENAVTKYFS